MVLLSLVISIPSLFSIKQFLHQLIVQFRLFYVRQVREEIIFVSNQDKAMCFIYYGR